MRLLAASLSLVTACSLPLQAEIVADSFDDMRLSVGFAPGFTKDTTTDSKFNGAVDRGGNRIQTQSAKPGIDIEPGLYLAGQFTDCCGLVFGASMVYRRPHSTYDSTSDTGVDNGAATGDVQAKSTGRIDASMFGAKMAIGPYLSLGIVRLELTPYVGIGSISADFQETNSYANDPLGIYAAQAGTATFREHGSYLQYGASLGVYVHAYRWPLLGAMAGWDGTVSRIKETQHGALEERQHQLRSGGLMAAAAIGWAF